MDSVEKKAAQVLQEEIGKRAGIKLDILNEWPKVSQPMIVVGLFDNTGQLLDQYNNMLRKTERPEKEGVIIRTQTTDRAVIMIIGAESR
jgi:hypothetical protein